MQYKLELVGELVPTAPDYGDVDETCDATSARPARSSRTLAHRAGVEVEIADAARLAAIRPAWNDLVARAAEPNAFMDPLMVRIAAEVRPDTRIQSLLAWQTAADGPRLVGLWAFAVGRPRKSPIPVRVLNVPPYLDGYLATPVVDSACLDLTLAAMLDAIADDPGLPKIVALDAMGDGPTLAALTRVLAQRGTAPCILQRYQRPKLIAGLDGKHYLERALSSSSRKKLRQHRRRLAAQGALKSVVVTDPQEVARALEDFLRVEASGWKGRQGTALLCDQADAALMRGAIVALAEAGCASIHGLYLDNRPVSLQVVVRSGAVAFTWKTAYDEHYQDVSPGMLLLEDYTTAFLSDASIASVDSCAHDETSFMSAWSERQPIVNLWIDARRGGSFTFSVVGGTQKLYRDLRARAKSAYHNIRRARARRPA